MKSLARPVSGIAVVGLLIVGLVAATRSSDAPAPPAGDIGVYFSPKGGGTDAIVRELGQAESSIRIQAYSFTSAPIAKAIIDAQKRGVQVEAVLDKSNRTDKYSAATFLKNAGCDVRIDARHAIAHNKIMLIDEKVILTGSFNFTKAAEESNAENLLVIRDHPELVEKYLANFRLHQEHAEPYQGPSGAAAAEEPTDDARPARFVGSRNSEVYHYSSCSAVGRISKENLVEYASAPPGKRLHEGCPE
jgi:phosphatidylserine/phosphatidylglycerophosphate/cardiolipin synthase-like enzyme